MGTQPGQKQGHGLTPSLHRERERDRTRKRDGENQEVPSGDGVMESGGDRGIDDNRTDTDANGVK